MKMREEQRKRRTGKRSRKRTRGGRCKEDSVDEKEE